MTLRHLAILAASAVLGVAAVGVARAALGPLYGGTLRVGVLDLPRSLDPGPAESASARLVSSLVHETLVGIGPEGLPVPGVAQSWSSAAGGREWTLTLADGARFHDGGEITPADALRALRTFLRSPSPAAEWLAQGLEGGVDFRARKSAELPGAAEAGPRQVVLRFVEALALPLAPLAAPGAAVTSAGGAGCGPFVPTVHLPGRRLALNAFAGHVRGRPYADEVELVVDPDRAALRSDLQAERIDFALGEPGASALAATLLLVLDADQPPFDKPQARAAAASAVDRADLARHWLAGGEPLASLLTPSLLALPGGEPAPTPSQGSGRIRLSVARDVPQLASQRVTALLTEAGFTLRVEAASPDRARRASSEARLLMFTPEVAEAGLALHELIGFVTPPADAREALDAAQRERDLDRRRALLLRAEAALRADGAWVGLSAAPVSAAVGRGVHGSRVDAGGRLRLEDAWREP